MAAACRPWWRNCALTADAEILEIDKMEEDLSFIDSGVSKVRELISGFELCHHKADRWVHNIIEAIGTGDTKKGLGTRAPNEQHPTEEVWLNACAALQAWCAGHPSKKINLSVGTIPASRLLAGPRERSPLKEWQVQRVIEKIRSVIHWPQSVDDPTAQYVWMLLGGGAYEAAYRNDCPEQYKEHEDFWLETVRTIIHDSENGADAELSLGLAIDMLWPCHRRFVENLNVVLNAIGGNLHPKTPFAACGRNIALVPNRGEMEIVSNTLRVFLGSAQPDEEIDTHMLDLLGEPTEIKKWLAASLDKTILLQLDPPKDLRAMSALEGPAWIKQ